MRRLVRLVWLRVTFAHRRCLRRIVVLERALGIGQPEPLAKVEWLDDWSPGAVWSVSDPRDIRFLSELGAITGGSPFQAAHEIVKRVCG